MEASVTIQTHVTTGRPHPGNGLAESIMAVIVVPWYVARPVAAAAVVREPSILVLNMNWVPVQACTKTTVFALRAGCTKDRVEAAWRDWYNGSGGSKEPYPEYPSRAGPSFARECMQHPREHFYPQSGSPHPRLHSAVARNK